MSGTRQRPSDTPSWNSQAKGIEEPDDQPSCCCCPKSSRPAKAANGDDRKGHAPSGSGKITMPDGQQNGETKKDVDHPSWTAAANSSNGEAIQRQDYKSGGSLTEEKKPDRVTETVSRSDAGQVFLKEKDKQASSSESFEDKILYTPEKKFSSPEADLSRKQQKGHSPLKTLGSTEVQQKVMKTLGSPEVQQKVYPPVKTLGSPEVQQKVYPPAKALGSSEVHLKIYPPTKTLGSPDVQQKVYPPTTTLGSSEVHQKTYPPTKTLGSPDVQQKVYPPKKTLGSPEVQQKIYPPMKDLGSPEVSHRFSNEPKKANPPMKTVSSTEAGGNFLLKEQQKIETLRKTGSSSTEAAQVWSKEQQKIEPPRKTVSSTETDQQSSKQQLTGFSPVRTENSSTQAGQLMSKEQQKIELPRKAVSSPQESQLLPNEKQKCLPIEKESDSAKRTSDDPKQVHRWSKEQEKDVIQEGTNRASNYAESNPAKVTNRSSRNQLEEQQKAVLKHGINSESHTKKNVGSAEQEGLLLKKEKQKDVVRQ